MTSIKLEISHNTAYPIIRPPPRNKLIWIIFICVVCHDDKGCPSYIWYWREASHAIANMQETQAEINKLQPITGPLFSQFCMLMTFSRLWLDDHGMTRDLLTRSTRAGSNYTKSLQLLWNINFNYNYTSIMLYSITPCSFQLQLQLQIHFFLVNYTFIYGIFVNRFGLFSRHLVSNHVWDKKPP